MGEENEDKGGDTLLSKTGMENVPGGNRPIFDLFIIISLLEMMMGEKRWLFDMETQHIDSCCHGKSVSLI